MGFESEYVWMNGKLLPYAEATVHFMTPALHYGAAVFEGIRCYNTDQGPAVFRLKEHIERLFYSSKVLGYEKLPYSQQEIIDAVKLTVSKNNFTECYIRPLVYMTSNTGFGLNLLGTEPHVGISAWKWGAMLGDDTLEKGIRANVSSFTRHHPNVTMTKAKIAGNYANSILAKTESARLGFDEAIMLDPQGYVAECTGENLFLIRDGKLLTTHTASVLEGITRDAIVKVAQDLGYEVKEQPISRDQLYLADEVFMCGTAAECVPVTEIDFRSIGSGSAGPVTRDIQSAFNQLIRGNHPRSAGWLDYVK